MSDVIDEHTGLPFGNTQASTEEEETFTFPQEEVPTEQPQAETISPSNPQLPIDPSCDYCLHKEKYQMTIDSYITKSAAKTGDRVAIPFIEDIALILNKNLDDINQWLVDETHIEFISSVKKLHLIQRLRLLQRVAGRFQPQGAIFLLEKLHGL